MSATTQAIQIARNGKVHTVTLFPGLAPAELAGLLETAFHLPTGSAIRGFQSSVTQELVPLSLLCHMPSFFAQNGPYNILLEGESAPLVGDAKAADVVQALPIAPPEQAMPPSAPIESPAPHEVDEEVAQSVAQAAASGNASAAQNTSQDSDERLTIEYKNQMMNFVERMHEKDLVTVDERHELVCMVESEVNVIVAAFLVGQTLRDVDHLANLIKDIGQNSLTDEGIQILETQMDLIDAAELLEDDNLIDETEKLLLFNLSLQRYPPLLESCRVFRATDNIEGLLQSLLGVVRTVNDPNAQQENAPADPRASQGASADQGQVALGSTEAGAGDTRNDDESLVAARREILSNVCNDMLQNGKLDVQEASVLKGLIEQDDDFLTAAVYNFIRDHNLLDLHDTLKRLATKRLAEEATVAEGATRWQGVIPDAFLRVVWTCVKQGFFQPLVGVRICDMFLEGRQKGETSLPEAAWEVFEAQEDLNDFLDTLFRLARLVREDASAAAPSPLQEEEPAGHTDKLHQKAVLFQTLRLLLEGQKIGNNEARVLMQAVEIEDPPLLLAAQRYLNTKDIAGLLSALTRRVAELAAAPQSAAGAGQADAEQLLPEVATAGRFDPSRHFTASQIPPGTMPVEQSEVPLADVKERLQLLALMLVEEKKLTEAEGTALVANIGLEDPRVLAAYDVFEDTGSTDVEDLIDTLVLVAKHNARAASAGAAPAGSPSPAPEAVQRNGRDAVVGGGGPIPTTNGIHEAQPAHGSLAATNGNGVAPAGDQEELANAAARFAEKAVEDIYALGESGLLDRHEVVVLTRLALSMDARVGAAFDVWLESEDLEDLVDSLKRIATRGINAEAPAQAENTGEEDAEDAPQDGGDVQARFQRIVDDMDLSALETTALRLCIARDDPILRAALEVLRLTGDSEDLQDTLKRLARKTVSETFREMNQGRAAANDDGHGDSNGNGNGNGNGNAFHLDGPTRARLVESVAAEMKNQGVISVSEMENLLKKLTDEDDVLNAAIDAYEMGGEDKLIELSDSLRRVAKI